MIIVSIFDPARKKKYNVQESFFVVFFFVHSISRFWFLVTFGNKVKKIQKMLRNLCLHFARQDGQDGKKPEKKITQIK